MLIRVFLYTYIALLFETVCLQIWRMTIDSEEWTLDFIDLVLSWLRKCKDASYVLITIIAGFYYIKGCIRFALMLVVHGESMKKKASLLLTF